MYLYFLLYSISYFIQQIDLTKKPENLFCVVIDGTIDHPLINRDLLFWKEVNDQVLWSFGAS